MANPIIAIDGPAGSGKSTVAQMVADRLGLKLLDTGAMYRAIALAVHRHPDAKPGEVAKRAKIEFKSGKIILDAMDVSEEIRSSLVDHQASVISTDPEVREALVAKQQKIIKGGGWVLEGRDTTTVVAPDADLKVFLTASVEERAHRRWLQRNKKKTLKEYRAEINKRDERDYSREHGRLRLAPDAHKIDSGALDAGQVVERIISLLEQEK